MQFGSHSPNDRSNSVSQSHFDENVITTDLDYFEREYLRIKTDMTQDGEGEERSRQLEAYLKKVIDMCQASVGYAR